MFRALWFFLQIAVVVCAVIWISTQKGNVDIVWNDYTLSFHLGIFLLCLTLFTLLALTIFRVFGALLSIPNKMSRRNRERARAKGFQALTRGFVAIAAGDAKKATVYARDVRRLLPDERGLPLLLEAQAARLRGEEGEARQSFEELLQDKDAAFFGIRGLLKSSMDEGDVPKALAYAKNALAQNPKQPWILKSVYDLEIQNHRWQDAFDTLYRVRKYKAIEDDKAKKDEIALLMLLAEEDRVMPNSSAWLKKIERAVKIDPSFVPAVVKLSEHYLVLGKKGKVISLVQQAWKRNPHPELVSLWDKVAPDPKSNDIMRRLRWFEKLVAENPDSADGQIAVAKAAMDVGMYGEAKAHLTVAENVRPTAQVFRLRADLEEQTSHNGSFVRDWLNKAADASPDAVWYCTLTGHIYEQWSPVAQPHGSFNTIEWGHPLKHSFGSHAIVPAQWQDPLMVEKI